LHFQAVYAYCSAASLSYLSSCAASTNLNLFLIIWPLKRSNTCMHTKDYCLKCLPQCSACAAASFFCFSSSAALKTLSSIACASAAAFTSAAAFRDMSFSAGGRLHSWLVLLQCCLFAISLLLCCLHDSLPSISGLCGSLCSRKHQTCDFSDIHGIMKCHLSPGWL